MRLALSALLEKSLNGCVAVQGFCFAVLFQIVVGLVCTRMCQKKMMRVERSVNENFL